MRDALIRGSARRPTSFNVSLKFHACSSIQWRSVSRDDENRAISAKEKEKKSKDRCSKRGDLRQGRFVKFVSAWLQSGVSATFLRSPEKADFADEPLELSVCGLAEKVEQGAAKKLWKKRG